MELQKMFIDGEWVEGSTGKSVPTLNPSNGEVLAMVTEGKRGFCEAGLHGSWKTLKRGRG